MKSPPPDNVDVRAAARFAGPRKGSLSLGDWATLAEAAMRTRRRKGKSGADLVIDERTGRLDG